jgi:hypothetical protein
LFLNLTAADGREKVHLAILAQGLAQPEDGWLSIHNHREAGAQAVCFYQALFEAGELLIQVFNDFPDSFPRHLDALLTLGQVAQ